MASTHEGPKMTFAIVKMLFSGLLGYLGALLSFLTTKPGVYVLIAAVAVGAYWYSGNQGYKRGVEVTESAAKLRQAAAETAAFKKGRADQAALDHGVIAAADKAGFARGKAEAKTRYITKRIPEYVTAETDRLFPVPCGSYRLLNAAADSADPATISLPPGLVDGDACPLSASDLADHGVAGAGAYHVLEAQVTGLQDLARSLAAAVAK